MNNTISDKKKTVRDKKNNNLDVGTNAIASPPSVAASLLSDSLFPPRKPKADTAMDNSDSDNNTTQVWRLYTKAKDTLPNGSRLENLTWRMMAMTLKKKEAAEKAKVEAQQSKIKTE
ncbi:unnamed protein product [Cunninghamella echinulata]